MQHQSPLITKILQYMDANKHIKITIILLKCTLKILGNEAAAMLEEQAITNIKINTIYYEPISYPISYLKRIIKEKTQYD